MNLYDILNVLQVVHPMKTNQPNEPRKTGRWCIGRWEKEA